VSTPYLRPKVHSNRSMNNKPGLTFELRAQWGAAPSSPARNNLSTSHYIDFMLSRVMSTRICLTMSRRWPAPSTGSLAKKFSESGIRVKQGSAETGQEVEVRIQLRLGALRISQSASVSNLAQNESAQSSPRRQSV
jgi:hypothetical protein